jgi:hypothetical protein
MQVNGIFPGELLPNETVAGCINIFYNAWPHPEKTIAAIENEISTPNSGVYWRKAGTIPHGMNQNYRTNYDMSITGVASDYHNDVAKNIHNQMYFLLLASTIPYAKKYGVEEMYHEPYNLLKYQFGQEYKSHYDGETSTGRSISAIVYLNNNYDGGEIEFTNFDIKIKPEPGMLLLFPSNYAYSHIAHPVTDGSKYAIVTWIKDRP